MNKLTLRQVCIEDKYLVMHSIGAGHFGDIRVAKDIETDMYYAVKLEDFTKCSPKLEMEMKLYIKIRKKYELLIDEEKKNHGFVKTVYGFPEVYQNGKFENYNYLIMELLGYNLETLYNSCNRKFTLKCVIMIGIQILNRLEFIHSCDIIFRDVKPENFVIGKESFDRGKIIYMLDFGLAKDVNDFVVQNETKGVPPKKVVGTSRYMSINAHKGKEQSQRDDLESLAYIMIYFSRGSLPWQGILAEDIQEKYRKILELKTSTKTSTLCKGLAIQFHKFLSYVKLLNFDEKPNYQHLNSILYDTLNSHSEVCDWKFDWDGKRNIMQINSTESATIAQNEPIIFKANEDIRRNLCKCLCCGIKESENITSRR